MTLKILLASIDACSEAVQWVGDRDLKTAWSECDRGDWMLWLCVKMEGRKGWPTRKQIVIVACDCAELSLPIYEKKYPKDNRPRKAIEIARKWTDGEATIEEVRSAAYAAAPDAAYAAAAYAAAAYAAYAAYAAAAAAASAAAYAA
jgi:hypothetical protein